MKNITTIDGKKHADKNSVFKQRLSSVIAFIMSRHFLFIIAAVVLIGLAACSKAEEEQASAPVVTTPDVPAVADESAAEANAESNLLQTLRENSGVLTREEQTATAERARDNAKNAALAVGQTEQEAESAGQAAFDAAERSLQDRQTN